MTISRDEIAAFADGELSGEREAEIAAAVKGDIELARQVDQHRMLKAKLAGHYAPIVDQPVPDRLAGLLTKPALADVIQFAAFRQKRGTWQMRRWTWMVGPALAASLALILFLPDGGDRSAGYANGQLAAVLDAQLVTSQSPSEDTRILLSFRNKEGLYCRAFSSAASDGIACRNDEGWKLETLGTGRERASTDYRMAGADESEILALAQEMAAGPALDADGERAARAQGWR